MLDALKQDLQNQDTAEKVNDWIKAKVEDFGHNKEELSHLLTILQQDDSFHQDIAQERKELIGMVSGQADVNKAPSVKEFLDKINTTYYQNQSGKTTEGLSGRKASPVLQTHSIGGVKKLTDLQRQSRSHQSEDELKKWIIKEFNNRKNKDKDLLELAELLKDSSSYNASLKTFSPRILSDLSNKNKKIEKFLNDTNIIPDIKKKK